MRFIEQDILELIEKNKNCLFVVPFIPSSTGDYKTRTALVLQEKYQKTFKNGVKNSITPYPMVQLHGNNVILLVPFRSGKTSNLDIKVFDRTLFLVGFFARFFDMVFIEHFGSDVLKRESESEYTWNEINLFLEKELIQHDNVYITKPVDMNVQVNKKSKKIKK